MLKKIVTHPFVFFPLAAVLVLWPIAFCVFTVKNDALTYYYPVRALISDALNNGELPLWTPFINFGYPLHADMQSGAWNPVVWLFSYCTHFSLTGFHAELLFYFSFAGIGFYYLCRQYAFSVTTALIFGLAYQFSGFMIDSVQFYACISSACYLPFILLFYKKMLVEHNATNSLLTAFFLYLLFTGGYPSIFIVTAYLLAAHYTFTSFTASKKGIFLKSFVPQLLLLTITFILLSLPAIISFVQYLSFIDRGKAQPLSFVLENSMPPAAMISLVSPFATTAVSRFIQTDPLMRNTYIGMIPLLFVLYGVFSKAIKLKADAKFFLVAAIVFFGMAWGSFFFLRQAAYYVLPLMNTFRHPALLRLFGIFCILLVGAYSFNQWQHLIENSAKLLRQVVLWVAVGIAVSAILLFIKNSTQIADLFQSLQGKNIKAFVTGLSFTQRLFVQLPFVFLLLLLIYFGLKNRKAFYLLPAIMLLDIFTASQFNIPVTVIGASSFKNVENEIGRNRIAFPIPSVTASINENASESYSLITGSKLPYTKKIGRNDYYITPGNLSAQEKMYESPLKDEVFKKTVLFVDGDSLAEIKINSFGANSVHLTATCNKGGSLVYLQNTYPGWHVFVDGNKNVIDTAFGTFMSVNLTAGKHEVKFQYKPFAVYAAWYVSLITLILLAGFVIRNLFFKKD